VPVFAYLLFIAYIVCLQHVAAAWRDGRRFCKTPVFVKFSDTFNSILRNNAVYMHDMYNKLLMLPDLFAILGL